MKNLYRSDSCGRAILPLRPVNIQRDCYAMATRADDSAEITLYGEIVEVRPVNLRTRKAIPGNFIIKAEFLKDLKAIEGVKKLTIRLDSLGGDAYASLLIYNRLRELQAKKIVQVDGVAMSGGSIIMCAGDTVRVNPGSLIMIHKTKSLLLGFYNSDELERVKRMLMAADNALAKAYSKRAGITEYEALELMSRETYMTGDEALKKGFADEIVTNEAAPAIAVSADHSTLYVNGRALAAMGYSLPESIPVVAAEGGKNENSQLTRHLMTEARVAACLSQPYLRMSEMMGRFL